MISAQNNINPVRRNILIYLALFIFLVLAAKLYQLQIVQYSEFAGIAEANRIRIVPVEAPRGIIYGRNGKIIAENIFQYNINIIPYEFSSTDSSYRELADLLQITPEQVRRRIQNNWRSRFLPVKVGEDIDFETLTYLEEHKLSYPGVLYTLEPIRRFPSTANLSHVIGYLREVDQADLKNIRHYGYRSGDLIGWKGVERQYENILRGSRGYQYLQVDVFGREIGSLDQKRNILPQPGNDLYLCVDVDLQTYAEQLLEKQKGVILCMDADNGEIYSFVSQPDYSPNLFSGIVESDVWQKLRDNPARPLYNRATQGLYPPGSTFKVNAALTALQQATVSRNWSVQCSGSYRLGRRSFKCWKESGHGRMNMHDAIVNSCNIYFYQLIRKMELDEWAETARLFRFGQKTNIDLPNESSGILPATEFLDRKYGKGGWTEGNKLNLVIGQGDLLVTPIQMVRYAASLATRGKLVQPHLGLQFFNKTSNQFTTFTAHSDSIEAISESTWSFIHEAMRETVLNRTGTARAARVKGLATYGKTGTAENPHGESHAWFMGFCHSPKVNMAVVVMVEHGGSGGGVAAPLAGKLFQYMKERGIL